MFASTQQCVPGYGGGPNCCIGIANISPGVTPCPGGLEDCTYENSDTKSPSIASCSGGKGFQTAIGCIPVESPQAFATFFIKWAMGIAGGISLVLIGYSGFIIMTSSGNPQKMQAGKELLTSAVSGLGLILFGIFALRFIGVDILQIPGFGV